MHKYPNSFCFVSTVLLLLLIYLKFSQSSCDRMLGQFWGKNLAHHNSPHNLGAPKLTDMKCSFFMRSNS